MIMVSVPSFLLQFITGGMPLMACRIFAMVGLTPFFGFFYHISLIAFERYMYFCRPMKYSHFITTRRVVLAMCMIYITACSYMTITEILIGRDYHPGVLVCNLSNPGFHGIFQIVVFQLPPAVVTIICSLKIWKLIKENSVPPHIVLGHVNPNSSTINEATNNQAIPVRQAKKAIRMILLISGALWGTYIPGMIIRTIIFNLGYTWEDIDTRSALVPALMVRLSTYVMSFVSSAVNPIIYVYTRKDLRHALFTIMGLKSSVAIDNP
jgi:hypothetical protein